MIERRRLCLYDGCTQEVDATSELGYCTWHHREVTVKKWELDKRHVERVMTQGFDSIAEIAELTKLPVHRTYQLVESIKKDTNEWLEAGQEERSKMVAEDMIRASKQRMQELWVHARNYEHDTVKAAAQMLKEQQHMLSVMQELGFVQKAAQKMEVKVAPMEAALSALEKSGRIIDVELAEDDFFTPEQEQMMIKLKDRAQVKFE